MFIEGDREGGREGEKRDHVYIGVRERWVLYIIIFLEREKEECAP